MDAENPDKIIFVRRLSSLVPRNKDFFFCGLTAILLILAFPKTDFWILAFFAFIPLFTALDRAGASRAFLLGIVTGIIFFAGTLYWFIHVTYVGAVLIVLYCSLYFGVFAFLYRYARGFSPYKRMLFICSCWVALEFARANLLSGFGWASLGYSQYTNLAFIQMADVTGVFGVSFAVMFVNIALKEAVDRSRSKENAFVPLVLIVLVVGLAVLYGQYRLGQKPSTAAFSVSVIQANIPQELKWYEPAWQDIFDKYFILTRQAALDDPDLIVWPETAFPGYIGEHDVEFDQLRAFVGSLGIPLLVGSVVTDAKQYYNSAVLLDEKGMILKQYDKLHLVPFGEYIPFRRWFPFLSQIVPIADFTPGDEFVLFSHPAFSGAFNVLICFEDSVSGLSREFAQRGSQLFINITNDAWFKDTKAPFLHLQSSVFRAVENRRSVIRSANTGISAFIGTDGSVKKVLSDASGRSTYISGFIQEKIMLNDKLSWYTRYGDMFSYAAFLLMLVLIFQRQMKPVLKRQRS